MLIPEPAGTGLVGPPVITRGAGWIRMMKPRVPLEPKVSDVATEKENCPGIVGVPETAPLADSVRPSGRLPPASEKLYGPLPPLAPREPEYGTPTVPTGKLPVGETCAGGEVTTMGNNAFTAVFAASCRVTATGYVPADWRTPEMTPVAALRTRPAGNPLAVQLYGGVPPLPFKVVE
jgi:hypothetical protein